MLKLHIHVDQMSPTGDFGELPSHEYILSPFQPTNEQIIKTTVAVPLCSTYYLFLKFWLYLENPSGLIVVDSDHLCKGCGDWLTHEPLGSV